MVFETWNHRLKKIRSLPPTFCRRIGHLSLPSWAGQMIQYQPENHSSTWKKPRLTQIQYYPTEKTKIKHKTQHIFFKKKKHISPLAGSQAVWPWLSPDPPIKIMKKMDFSVPGQTWRAWTFTEDQNQDPGRMLPGCWLYGHPWLHPNPHMSSVQSLYLTMAHMYYSIIYILWIYESNWSILVNPGKSHQSFWMSGSSCSSGPEK